MSSRCQFCTKLTIESLVDLAKNEFCPGSFPLHGYYQHHPSFGHLESAALAGCDLCRLILDCFRGCVRDPEDFWSMKWDDAPSPGERTMYSRAKTLPISDVKLAITASYADLPATLGDVKLLDKIDVHLGPVNKGRSVNEFPLLRLVLTKNHDGPPHRVHSHAIGRNDLGTNLGSASNHAIVQSWFHECTGNHAGCWPKEPPPLPTRVLDVGLENDHVCVATPPPLTRRRYAALSHCWGGRIEQTLKRTNSNQFQKSIPWSSLPANFRDAIIITRNLGIRYLWIDSLCIVQDSRDDWEKESVKMGSIYRDAAAVIFAAASRGSNGGILNDRPLDLGPKPVKLKIFNGAANAATATLSYFQPDTDETLDKLLNSCPLVSRGWTLQEASLSSRSITYGIRGIYWQCPQQFRGANGTWEGGAENFPQRRTQLNSVLHRCDSFESPLDCRKLFDEYYDLVEDYSRRKLTNSSDKLPAISAITAAMSVALGQGSSTATYLAGLWDIDLPRGLMWQPVEGACRAKDYRSPSWSWASIDGRIKFPAHTELSWQAETWHLKLLDYSVDLQNRSNSFGEINTCRIVVECLTIPLLRSSQKAHRPEFQVGSCAYDFPLYGDTEVREPEEVFEVVKNERTYLMTFENMVASEDDESAVEQTIDVEPESQIEHKILIICIGSQSLEENQAKGLIVSKRSGSSDYERVGFLRWFLMDYTSLKPEMETLTVV